MSNVCPNCFSDKELKSFISSSIQKGNCDFCDSINQPLLDINELFSFFSVLTECFSASENGTPLSLKIQSDWNLFSSNEVASKILDYVILFDLVVDKDSSDTKVDYAKDIADNFKYWEVLKDKLKWSSRFINDIEKLEELGWDGFFNTTFYLNSSVDLYRARLHHESGKEVYDSQNMFCPPRENASSGRANPLGIPYLYLSEDQETVLYEIRASYLDELSIGTFQLKPELSSIKIVDFTEDISLFQPDSNAIVNVMKENLLRRAISSDLSKPMRRYDNELEYIPTQFICEYIKLNTGASGIRFNSSLHPKGKNIVLFDKDLVNCSSVIKVKIDSVLLSKIEL